MSGAFAQFVPGPPPWPLPPVLLCVVVVLELVVVEVVVVPPVPEDSSVLPQPLPTLAKAVPTASNPKI
jgi:hypothetical protein